MTFDPISLTVLSRSTIALGGQSPPSVQVWDWKQGTVLHTLTSFTSSIISTALHPDGRLVVADYAGKLYIDKVSSWSGTPVVAPGDGTHAILVGRDGSFVTGNQKDGSVKLWRDDQCVATFKDVVVIDPKSVSQNPLAIVGGRVVVAGKDGAVVLDL